MHAVLLYSFDVGILEVSIFWVDCFRTRKTMESIGSGKKKKKKKKLAPLKLLAANGNVGRRY